MLDNELTVHALAVVVKGKCDAMDESVRFRAVKRTHILKVVCDGLVNMVNEHFPVTRKPMGIRVARTMAEVPPKSRVPDPSSTTTPRRSDRLGRVSRPLKLPSIVQGPCPAAAFAPGEESEGRSPELRVSQKMLNLSASLKGALKRFNVDTSDSESFLNFFIGMVGVDFGKPRCVVYKSDPRIETNEVGTSDAEEEMDKYVFRTHGPTVDKTCSRCNKDTDEYIFTKRRITFAVAVLYFRTYGEGEELDAMDDVQLVKLLMTIAPRPSWIHNDIMGQVLVHCSNNGTQMLWSGEIESDRLRRTLQLVARECKASVRRVASKKRALK
jgi:hypothetical protein